MTHHDGAGPNPEFGIPHDGAGQVGGADQAPKYHDFAPEIVESLRRILAEAAQNPGTSPGVLGEGGPPSYGPGEAFHFGPVDDGTVPDWLANINPPSDGAEADGVELPFPPLDLSGLATRKPNSPDALDFKPGPLGEKSALPVLFYIITGTEDYHYRIPRGSGRIGTDGLIGPGPSIPEALDVVTPPKPDTDPSV